MTSLALFRRNRDRVERSDRRSRLSRFAAFVRAPAEPIVAPFHANRAPFQKAMRKTLFMVTIVFISMIYAFLYTLFPPFFIFILALPIVVLALMVLWAMPDRHSVPTGSLEAVFFAYLVACFVWPNYLSIALPGMPWLSLRRVFGVLMTVMLLYSVSTSSRMREEMKQTMSTVPMIWRLVAAFTAIQFLTIFTSERPFSALFFMLNVVTIWQVPFFIAIYVFAKPGRIRRWLMLYGGIATALCLLGLFEIQHKAILWANHIPSFLKIEDRSVLTTLAAVFRDGRYRVTTTFSVSLSFAEFLTLIVPFILHRLMNSRSLWHQLAFAALDALMLFIIYNTGSRLGMVGWVVGHVGYIGLWSIKRWHRQRTDLMAAALTFAYPVAVVVLGSAIMTVDALKFRILGGGQSQISDDARRIQAEMTRDLLMKNPFGHGAGQGADALGFFTPDGYMTIDSYILSAALDYGVIGFCIFFGLIIYAMWKATKLGFESRHEETDWAMPLAITFAVFLVGKLVLSQEENHTLIFMMLAMVPALYERARLIGQPVQDRKHPLPATRRRATA